MKVTIKLSAIVHDHASDNSVTLRISRCQEPKWAWGRVQARTASHNHIQTTSTPREAWVMQFMHSLKHKMPQVSRSTFSIMLGLTCVPQLWYHRSILPRQQRSACLCWKLASPNDCAWTPHCLHPNVYQSALSSLSMGNSVVAIGASSR